MSQRPQGRKRNDSGQHATAHRRDDNGIGGSASGNVNYNNRPSGGGGGVVKGIGGLGLGAILIYMLMNGLGGNGGGGSTTITTNPVVGPASTPTPIVANNNTQSSTGAFHFGTQTSQQSSAVNASTAAVDTSVSSGIRDKYTTLLGNGQDTMTIMVYMCGTDLETNYGMATQDINEMASATMSDKVNIILATGGTKRWKNSIISNTTNQYYQVKEKSLVRLEDNLGSKAMTDSNTLTAFIKFCTKNFPANRNMLIFWDHGGGSVTGYGYDQLYPNGSMSVDKIAQALNAGGTKFDIIGFDACLMANMEAAIAIEPFADYMLASEETEPGTGWYYTNWLSQLARNTSMPSLEIGKNVIDDFVSGRQAGATARDVNTLSIIDLAELSGVVPSRFTAFAKSISASVKENNYRTVADARSACKEFSSSNRLDQIDLVDFCKKLNTKEAKALVEAIQKCVKYNRSRNINNAYGLSIYFPYRNPKYMNALMRIYDNIDFDSEYGSAIRSFATLATSGQVSSNATSSSLFDLLGGAPASNGSSVGTIDLLSLLTGGGQTTQPSTSSSALDLLSLLGGAGGADTSSLDLFSQFIGRNHIDSADLMLQEKNGQRVLSLSEDDWAMVQNIRLNVWVDDGSGYIDLGADNVYSFTDDGDLLIDYDGMWVAIEGQPVCYYTQSYEYETDYNYCIEGYVPAMLNGEEVHLIIQYNQNNPEGVVLGAKPVYDDSDAVGKLVPINEGDTIDFICDYYDYEGNFSDRYFFSDQIVADDELNVSDVHLDNPKMIYGYILQDIYGSDRRTPMVNY
ncbi:MAG: hypothetical protein IKD69_13575 [Solobacterium sp.]|nr:hypothetical protein [Solobacterium sp.]